MYFVGYACSYIEGRPPSARVTGAPSSTIIAFCYLLVIVYALTLAPVAWVYAAEVWSLETRASGMGIAALGNWLFNFALGLFVPPVFIKITYKIFIIFGILCFGTAVQAFFIYPETSGQTIEEIKLLFAPDGPAPWKTKAGSRLDAEIHTVIDRKAGGGAGTPSSATSSRRPTRRRATVRRAARHRASGVPRCVRQGTCVITEGVIMRHPEGDVAWGKRSESAHRREQN